jgi:hypothetical protein
MRLSLIGRPIFGIILSTTLVFSQPSLRFAIQSIPLQRAEAGPFQSLQEQPANEKKSVLVAIAYSLVLPGLGDLYADNFQTGKYFIGADAGLWITYGAVRTYGNWLKEDARTYAVDRAGANFTGKGDQFAVDIGNYVSVGEYNAVKLRNRDIGLVYDPTGTVPITRIFGYGAMPR